MIQIHNLKVVKQAKTICRVSELSIGQGERVGIIGPNGSGKTTLLRVLASLEPQYSGDCRLDVNLGDRVYVHQVPYLLRGSVMFNVTYGLRCRGLPHRQREPLASEWLRRLHIEHLADRTGRDLSGGERRRVALARALVLRPRLLLLDEPLADLDASGVDDLQSALEQLPDTTVLIASPTEPRPAFHLRCVTLVG